jgi:MerR family transcriptional regulator, light-induced transcriptional regulator
MMKNIANEIAEKEALIATKTMEKVYTLQRELVKNYKEEHQQKSVRDLTYHLNYLSEALLNQSPQLFTSYIDWARIIMKNIGIDAANFQKNLQFLQETIAEEVGTSAEMEDIFQKAYVRIQMRQSESSSYLQPDNPMYQEAQNYLKALLKADRNGAYNIIMKLLNHSEKVKNIYLNVFQPVQYEIGRLWQTNQISVAQEHFCTAATQMIMSQLYPHIFSTPRIGKKMLATSVSTELHELGIRMVADMFELEGWDTYYLGANTPPNSIIKAIEEFQPQLVAISATMIFNLKHMRELIEAIKHMGNRKFKIMVGGYPFNIETTLWEKVGADAYSPNAITALQQAEQMIG